MAFRNLLITMLWIYVLSMSSYALIASASASLTIRANEVLSAHSGLLVQFALLLEALPSILTPQNARMMPTIAVLPAPWEYSGVLADLSLDKYLPSTW